MDIQQKLDLIIENQTKMQNDIYQLKSLILRNQRNNMQSPPSPSQSPSDINDNYYSDTDSEDGVKVSPNLMEACRDTNIKYLNKNDQGQSLAWAPPKEPGLHNSKPILNNETK